MRLVHVALLVGLLACGKQVEVPADDDACVDTAVPGEPAHEPRRSHVFVGTPSTIEIGSEPIDAARMHTVTCARERCLVVYTDPYAEYQSMGLLVGKPDGAPMGVPLPLGRCFGPVASDRRGFAVLCEPGHGILRVCADGRTREIPTELEGEDIVWQDDAYLIVEHTEGPSSSRLGPLRIHRLTSDDAVEPAGCCEAETAGWNAFDLELIPSDAGPFYVWMGTSDDSWPYSEAVLLSPSADRIIQRIALVPGSAWVSAAVLRQQPLLIGGVYDPYSLGDFWVEGFVSRIDWDRGTLSNSPSELVHDEVSLSTVAGSYYVTTRPWLTRLDRAGEPIEDEATPRLPTEHVVPLSATRFAGFDISGGELTMQLVEYETW